MLHKSNLNSPCYLSGNEMTIVTQPEANVSNFEIYSMMVEFSVSLSTIRSTLMPATPFLISQATAPTLR